MALLRLEDFDPNYRSRLGGDIQSFDVYLNPNEHVGRVVDVWVDEIGNIQNLTIDLGSSQRSKRVMVPFGQSQVDRQARRIYISGLSRSQIEQLSTASNPPANSPDVRSQPTHRVASLEESAPLEAPNPRSQRSAAPKPAYPPTSPSSLHPSPSNSEATVHHPTPTSAQSSTIYGAHEYRDPSIAPQSSPAEPESSEVVEQQNIPLREERLIVDHKRQKMGEVVVRKEIETEIIEVPVQREKLIVEQVGETDPLAEIDLHKKNRPV